MLRAGLRPLQNGASTSRILSISLSPLKQFQIRRNGSAQTQAAKSMGEIIVMKRMKRRVRNKNTRPVGDLFDFDIGAFEAEDQEGIGRTGMSKAFGRHGKGPKSKRDHNSTSTSASPNTKNRTTSNSQDQQGKALKNHSASTPAQPYQHKPLPTILYTKDYILNNLKLPTAAEYGLKFDPVANCSKILKNSSLVAIQRRTRQLRGAKDHHTTIDIFLPGETTPRFKPNGSGSTPKEATEAAELHAICQLHQKRLLHTLLPGGINYWPPVVDRATRTLEADAKMHIIDLAARYDCLPQFSWVTVKGKGKDGNIRAQVSIPALGLCEYGVAKSTEGAILDACIYLKRAAESQHLEKGEGILLLQDYTTLNTGSAKKFIEFYCSRKGMMWDSETKTVKLHQKGGIHTATITLDQRVKESTTPSSPESSKRMYEGIAMVKKAHASATACLVAALALKQESQDLWEEFVMEMKRGKGEVLLPLSPIDLNVDIRTVEIMKQASETVTEAGKENYFNIVSEERRAQQTRSTPPLTESQLEMKSRLLKHRLNLYEQNPSLAILRQKRSELPMVQYKDQVMKLVLENDVCVVVGATGSGKTTQLPQLILDDLIRAGKGASCNIICTQPRRIAAVSVAARVAVERNEPLPGSVGYSVRFDSRRPQKGGSIHYCTTGILLKQLQDGQDQVLDGISHIIVDEVHERDLNIDFLLVILRRLIVDRKNSGKPPIKIIMMSATIDTTLFCKYFGEGFPDGRCPYIEVPGRTFPVTSHYLGEVYNELERTYSNTELGALYDRESRNYVDSERALSSRKAVPSVDSPVGEEKAVINWDSQGSVGEDGEAEIEIDRDNTTPIGFMALTVAHILKTTPEGSILVFLPGLQEIDALERMLKQARPLGIDFSNHPEYKLYTLHSSIPQMQQEVFEKLKPGWRKVILATNIAETSITIPDVVYVVDSCKHRELQYDAGRNISQLTSTWIAKSNAKQRAGRAGRVQNGHYYSMASTARDASFDASQRPEMLRADLQEVCLQIKSLGIKDIWGFLRSAIEPPAQATVEFAIDQLQALAALDDEENLTPLGNLLSSLPLTPSLGKMVVLGAIFKCLDPILILAAVSTSKSPFLLPRDRREEADAARLSWAQGTGSDHVAVISAFQEWRVHMSQGDGKNWAYQNFLHHNSLLHISRVAEQILITLEQSGIIEARMPVDGRRGMRTMYGSWEDNVNAESVPLQTALATAGFYPNLAVRTRKNPARFLRTIHENHAEIHISSAAAPRPASGKRYGTITSNEAAPDGTIFVFAEKTQADDQGISLRTVARTSPLAVLLFTRRFSLNPDDRRILVDQWLPFWVHRRVPMYALLNFKRILDEYLGRTFSRLGAANRKRLFAEADEAAFLDEDHQREPLVKSLVDVLEQAQTLVPTTVDRRFRHPWKDQDNPFSTQTDRIRARSDFNTPSNLEAEFNLPSRFYDIPRLSHQNSNSSPPDLLPGFQSLVSPNRKLYPNYQLSDFSLSRNGTDQLLQKRVDLKRKVLDELFGLKRDREDKGREKEVDGGRG